MTEHERSLARGFSNAVLVLALCGVAGCASLLPSPSGAPALFVLDDGAGPDVLSAAAPRAAPEGPTLSVTLPKAAPGFDSARLVYRRRSNELESFAHSEWIEPPARMLAPLIRRALARTGAFAAVVDASTAAATDLRLDSEIVRLQQDFTVSPSRARLTLLVTVVDSKTRRVVVTRQFEASEPAVTDDPRGSVDAANRVVANVLGEAAAFVAAATRR